MGTARRTPRGVYGYCTPYTTWCIYCTGHCTPRGVTSCTGHCTPRGVSLASGTQYTTWCIFGLRYPVHHVVYYGFRCPVHHGEQQRDPRGRSKERGADQVKTHRIGGSEPGSTASDVAQAGSPPAWPQAGGYGGPFASLGSRMSATGAVRGWPPGHPPRGVPLGPLPDWHHLARQRVPLVGVLDAQHRWASLGPWAPGSIGWAWPGPRIPHGQPRVEGRHGPPHTWYYLQNRTLLATSAHLDLESLGFWQIGQCTSAWPRCTKWPL